MRTQKIRSVKRLGEQDTLDLSVESKDHNFYAEGIVVSNCYSYSYITAYTTYLKANRPIEFYWAALKLASAETKPHECVATIECEMRAAGYKLLPPHMVESELEFRIVSPTEIRYALGLIRGISDSSLQKVEMFRASLKGEERPCKFTQLQAFRNAGLNIGITCSLIQSGCLDGYESYVDSKGQAYQSRSRLVLEACTWHLLTDAEKGYMMDVGAHPAVQWDVLKGVKHLNEVAKNAKGKPMLPDRRFGTIQKRYQPHKEIYLQNSRNERLANFWYERSVLGYSYSEKIGDIFADHIDGLVTVAAAKKLPKDRACRLIGFVGDPLKSKTKKGNDQLRFDLSDETGTVTVRVFNDRIALIEEQNQRSVVEGDLVIVNVKSTGDGGGFFAQQGSDGICVGIQTCRIFMKLSELKDAKSKDAAAEEVAAQAASATAAATTQFPAANDGATEPQDEKQAA